GGVDNGGTDPANTAIFNALNTIVIGNSQTSGADVVGRLSGISSHNLTSIPTGMTLNSILQTVVNTNPVQPVLAINGGPVKSVALAPQSPAIGAGGILTRVTATGDGGTILTVNAGPFVAPGDVLKIGSEIVIVTALPNVTTLIVQRAQDGTTQTNL